MGKDNSKKVPEVGSEAWLQAQRAQSNNVTDGQNWKASKELIDREQEKENKKVEGEYVIENPPANPNGSIYGTPLTEGRLDSESGYAAPTPPPRPIVNSEALANANKTLLPTPPKEEPPKRPVKSAISSPIPPIPSEDPPKRPVKSESFSHTPPSEAPPKRPKK